MNNITSDEQDQIKEWLKDVSIRPARRADLEKLEWEGEYIRFRNIYLEVFQRSRKGFAQMWVVDLEGFGLIGQAFVQFYPKKRFDQRGEKQAYIHAFRVRSKYRGAGIGTMLMEHIENILIDKGIDEITLNVAKENQGALRLYKNLGYQLVGETSGRWWYHDHLNKLQEVVEPSWRLIKRLP
jgi:ribosomal protein S18 acetylase RimI-like enzyme